MVMITTNIHEIQAYILAPASLKTSLRIFSKRMPMQYFKMTHYCRLKNYDLVNTKDLAIGHTTISSLEMLS
jgi:hypothetical protein